MGYGAAVGMGCVRGLWRRGERREQVLVSRPGPMRVHRRRGRRVSDVTDSWPVHIRVADWEHDQYTYGLMQE